jgi:FdhE protein
MRQGETAPKSGWVGNAMGGVKAPEPILLPNAAVRFARTAERLERLSKGHPMEGWLDFMAKLASAQHRVATMLPPFAAPDEAAVDQLVAARIPPISADGHRRDPAWRAGLALLLDTAVGEKLQSPAAAVVAGLRARTAASTEALADALLRGVIDEADAGFSFWIAAALQVYFARLAGRLSAPVLRLLEQRSLCPCCGSTPSVSLVTASGQNPGARYLHCSLCSTRWNHSRAVCVTCGGSRTVALRGIEGDSGLVKAETCDECGTYSKMLYEAKDMQADPYADDFATLGLDVMVGETGWARHAPNPLLLVGSIA